MFRQWSGYFGVCACVRRHVREGWGEGEGGGGGWEERVLARMLVSHVFVFVGCAGSSANAEVLRAASCANAEAFSCASGSQAQWK